MLIQFRHAPCDNPKVPPPCGSPGDPPKQPAGYNEPSGVAFEPREFPPRADLPPDEPPTVLAGDDCPPPSKGGSPDGRCPDGTVWVNAETHSAPSLDGNGEYLHACRIGPIIDPKVINPKSDPQYGLAANDCTPPKGWEGEWPCFPHQPPKPMLLEARVEKPPCPPEPPGDVCSLEPKPLMADSVSGVGPGEGITPTGLVSGGFGDGGIGVGGGLGNTGEGVFSIFSEGVFVPVEPTPVVVV